MLGFWWVSSSKNCSSVGLNVAGAWTSTNHEVPPSWSAFRALLELSDMVGGPGGAEEKEGREGW